jgi:hypothetical protein
MQIESDISQLLGSRFAGRRYLRYADLKELGIVENRGTLKVWIERGAFPPGIRIAGPSGRTLVWSAAEVAGVIAERANERQPIKQIAGGTS